MPSARWCAVARIPVACCGRSGGTRARARCRAPTRRPLAVAQVEQDDVDDAVGRLDLGPLVALEDVLDDQRMEPEGLADLRAWLARRARSGRPRPACRASAPAPGSLASAAVALELVEPFALRATTTRSVPGSPGGAGRAVALDAHAERDVGRLVRGRGRVRASRGHRRRVLRQRSRRSCRPHRLRRPAYASVPRDDRRAPGSAGWRRR